MKELFDNRIHIHARKELVVAEVAHWPAPKKYQFYELVFEGYHWFHLSKLVSQCLSAFEVVRHRPDINCLAIQLHDLIDETTREAFHDLLKRTDRSWSVWLDVMRYKAFDPPELKRALAFLENVQYLSLTQRSRDINRTILDSLPSFSQLKRLELHNWRIYLTEMAEFFANYPFAPLVHGLCLYNFDSITEPVFSGEVAPLIRTLGFRLTLSHISVLVAGLRTLSSLETLRVDLTGVYDEDPESLRSLLNWLSSDQCPVKDLTFEALGSGHHLMLLAILPRIPKLKTIQLDYYWKRAHDLKHLFPILLETPLLETIVLLVCELEEKTCNQILSFQLDNRPRLFAVELQCGRLVNEEILGLQKIRHVSLVYQTLRNFRNSKDHASFPMSAWSIVLEKLGSAFDCPSPDIHAVGLDARLQVIQELLERPHKLMER